MQENRSPALTRTYTKLSRHRSQQGRARRPFTQLRLEQLEDRTLLSLGAGSPDATFGTGGQVFIDYSQSSSVGSVSIQSVAIQPDGDILVAGQMLLMSNGVETGQDFMVARFLGQPDPASGLQAGALDPTFGNNGVALIAFSSSDAAASSMVLQPDGDIVVVGTATEYRSNPYDSNLNAVALARLTPSGALDPSFGTGGEVLTTFNGSVDNAADAVALQADGKIVVAGWSDQTNAAGASVFEFAVARYTQTGALDPSFGIGGEVLTAFRGGSGDDSANSVAIQPNGDIVVAGTSAKAQVLEFALARYTPSGVLDPTFGVGGEVVNAINGSGVDSSRFITAGVTGLALEPDGDIVAAGNVSFLDGSGFALASYTSSGALDPTFGRDGQVVADVNALPNAPEPISVAVQPNGDIVASCEADLGYVLLARFTPTGAFDQTFGTGGQVFSASDNPNFGLSEVDAVALDANGDIIVAGDANASTAMFVARYLGERPDIVLDAVSTKDANELTVQYDVNANLQNLDVQSVEIAVYRSNQPAYNPAANNVEVASYDLTGSQLKQGADQCITINSGNGHWGMNSGTLVSPLVSDPNLPYVIAVIDPDEQLPTDVLTDSTQAHFQIYNIIAVTHGQQFLLASAWVGNLVAALQAEYNAVAPNDAIVFPVYWSSLPPAPGQTQMAGNDMYDQIAAAAVEDFPVLQPDDIIDVQLIGHSRGASVIGVAMEDLVTLAPELSFNLQHGFYQMTFLDPHPANGDTVDDASLSIPIVPGLLSLPAYWTIAKLITTYVSSSQTTNDAPIVVPDRVNEVEDFFQNNPISTLSSESIANSFLGSEQYINLWGDPDEINIADPTTTLNYTINISPIGVGHSEVPLWYLTNLGSLTNGSPPPNPIPPWPANTASENVLSADSEPDLDQLLVIPASLEAASGAPAQVYVIAVNADGVPDASFGGSVTLALENASGGTLSGTLTENAVNGVAVFGGVSVDTPGDGYVLQASAVGEASGSSPPFDVLTDQLAITSGLPSNSSVGTSFPVEVQAENGSGGIDASFDGQVTVALTDPSTDSQLVTLNLNAVNGVADSTITLSQPGQFVLSATATGIASAFGTVYVSTVSNLPSPSFVSLSAPVIACGTSSETISGELLGTGNLGAVPAGELIQITLDGNTQNVALASDGSFSTTFATGALPVVNSPYTISFNYAGDGAFGTASATSSLTVASTLSSILQGVLTGSLLLGSFPASSGPYTASVNWGDGNSDTSGEANSPLSIVATDQLVQVFGSHAFAESGQLTVAVTLNDSTGSSTLQYAVADVAANVSGEVGTSRSGYTYNRSTKFFNGSLTVTNTGTTSLSGSLDILLQGLTPGVKLANATITIGGTTYTLAIGLDSAGDPCIHIPQSLLALDPLTPGQSLTISLQFSDPSLALFGFNPQAFSDPFDQ